MLNMTTMTDEEMLSEVKQGMQKINDKLELNLPDLIRTGGYMNHTKSRDATFERKGAEDNFNYSTVTGAMSQ